MFGVTHICARDGYSGKVVAFASMPVKNNVEMYKHVFRSVLVQSCMWIIKYSIIFIFTVGQPLLIMVCGTKLSGPRS